MIPATMQFKLQFTILPVSVKACVRHMEGVRSMIPGSIKYANCIRSCPFNKPAGLWRNCVRWGIRNAPRLNKLFLWGDDVLGCGRKKKAARFWSD